ncbi:MAG: DUF1788 domain-containing protein [Blastocatellia bacterium]|nr:DUF1788 domain-containing protein [Blastocatellia bacterium]
MSSLKSDFDELRERIRHGRELGYASFEPIFYLIFPPSQILEVKRQTPAWIAKLRNEGWEVTTFSIAEEIESILEKDPRRSLWLMADARAPQDWNKTNQSIANALTNNGALQQRLELLLSSLEGRKNNLVLVTDLEALHPYLRIGAIESQLQGKFHVPTIFLYPGVRTGKTRLKFLGFYPEDGNYRSVHVGG